MGAGGVVRSRAGNVFICLALSSAMGAAVSAQAASPAPAPPRVLRLNGLVEPVRSHTVAAPRLTGSAAPGVPAGQQLIVVRLAQAGTFVKRGDLLVEFDRHAQLRNARDREAEFRDILEQINKKRGEHHAARAMRDTQLKQTENEVRIAELGVLGNELVAKTIAEKNVQTLEEARATVAQLRKTFDLRRRAEEADLRILEIQRDRASNAWRHSQRNAEKMRIVSPIDGLVVLKSIWKNGRRGTARHPDSRRGRYLGDAGACQRQPGGCRTPVGRTVGPDHARLVPGAHVRWTPRTAFSDRHDQLAVPARPDLRRLVLDRRQGRALAARSRGRR
jgi:multidrug efflux pump subunit AcrA (membrane-fusion protein)